MQELYREIVSQAFADNNIEYWSLLSFEECSVINNELLTKHFGDKKPKNILIFLAPYYTGRHIGRNVSLYAVPRDYHIFFKKLFLSIEGKLKRRLPNYIFKGFADHSPINEVDAAAKAGLGIIGDNKLLINEKYGSFVFIGALFSDFPLDDIPAAKVIGDCPHCRRCISFCPTKPVSECLSQTTQRRGDLEPEAIFLISESGIAWGCDLCQINCPLNEDIEITPIEFFHEDLLPVVPLNCEIAGRAYAWRGKTCIHRNLKYVYEAKINDKNSNNNDNY